MIISGVLLAIGTFLPWVSVNASVAGASLHQSLAGIKAGEGKITLLCALVTIVAGVLALTRSGKLGLITILPAAVSLLLLVKVFHDKGSVVSSLGALGASVKVSLEVGFYVTGAMAVVVLLTGVLSAVTGRSK